VISLVNTITLKDKDTISSGSVIIYFENKSLELEGYFITVPCKFIFRSQAVPIKK